MRDGDLAIVDRSMVPYDGDGDVVVVDGERSFKVWTRKGGRVGLAFAHPRYSTFVFDPDVHIKMWGVIADAIRQPLRTTRG